MTGQPKMLRITGDPQKVEHAKQLVADIINAQARDDGPGGGGGGGGVQRSFPFSSFTSLTISLVLVRHLLSGSA